MRKIIMGVAATVAAVRTGVLTTATPAPATCIVKPSAGQFGSGFVCSAAIQTQ
ncbi:hypothetical protein [Luedemannella helvata]|uniref:Uncharacterized protein n=1 Tax=Luedemannella helvata TaxID=349315 RepID=A0ABN2KV75_9ACTN